MNISRLRFVLYFLIFAYAFLFVSTALLQSPPNSFLGSESQANWQSVLSTILSPIKVIVIGPLLPFIKFMHQDPDTPPPFFLIGFALHWAIMALIIDFMIEKIKRQLPTQQG